VQWFCSGLERKTTPVLGHHIAHYGFFVTFRGADFSHSVLMRRERIAESGFRLESRKVTMNHIIMEQERGAEPVPGAP
jgi:hypothetical protein